MAITETERLRLHEHFKAEMGEELAATMMESLPPAGWGDVATKQDIEHLSVATKQAIEHLSVATKHDIEDLRVATGKDIEHLSVATKQAIEHLSVATKQDIEHVRSELQMQIRHFREYVEIRFDNVATKDSVAELKAEMHRALRLQVLALVMVMPVIQGMTMALSRQLS